MRYIIAVLALLLYIPVLLWYAIQDLWYHIFNRHS